MITVSIRRTDLTDHHACERGLALFDSIKVAYDDRR
jgi:hypothetical protein